MYPGVVSARVRRHIPTIICSLCQLFPQPVPAISYTLPTHSGKVGLLQTQVGLPQGLSSLDLARAKKIVPGPQFLAAHSGPICAETNSPLIFRHI